jgi:hypothetical protein
MGMKSKRWPVFVRVGAAHQRAAPGDLARQRPRIGPGCGIRRLGLGGQFGDVGGELGAELRCPI